MSKVRPDGFVSGIQLEALGHPRFQLRDAPFRDLAGRSRSPPPPVDQAGGNRLLVHDLPGGFGRLDGNLKGPLVSISDHITSARQVIFPSLWLGPHPAGPAGRQYAAQRCSCHQRRPPRGLSRDVLGADGERWQRRGGPPNARSTSDLVHRASQGVASVGSRVALFVNRFTVRYTPLRA